MQSNAKGSVLAYSLIILSVMLLIAISLSAVTLTQTKSSLTGQNSSQAFQTADSGVQVVLKKIKKAQPTANVNSIGCSGAGIITGSLSAGAYEVQLYEYDSSSGADVPMSDCSASVGDISKIKSVGKYAGTARAVEVAVAAGSECSDYYDSGWFAVSSNNNNEISKAHGLGEFPNSIEIASCGAVSGSNCTTRIDYGFLHTDYATPRMINPVSITADENNIYLGISNYDNMHVWGYWTPSGYKIDGDADGDGKTGFYRIFACK